MKKFLFQTFQRKTCVFPTHARTKVTVNHLDSRSNATVPWATKENTAKVSTFYNC